jgi:hypothetical protein
MFDHFDMLAAAFVLALQALLTAHAAFVTADVRIAPSRLYSVLVLAEGAVVMHSWIPRLLLEGNWASS